MGTVHTSIKICYYSGHSHGAYLQTVPYPLQVWDLLKMGAVSRGGEPTPQKALDEGASVGGEERD